MGNVTSRSEKSLCNYIKLCILYGGFKSVFRMMTMFSAYMTRDTEVKVGTIGAGNKMVLRQFFKMLVSADSR